MTKSFTVAQRKKDEVTATVANLIAAAAATSVVVVACEALILLMATWRLMFIAVDRIVAGWGCSQHVTATHASSACIWRPLALGGNYCVVARWERSGYRQWRC